MRSPAKPTFITIHSSAFELFQPALDISHGSFDYWRNGSFRTVKPNKRKRNASTVHWLQSAQLHLTRSGTAEGGSHTAGEDASLDSHAFTKVLYIDRPGRIARSTRSTRCSKPSMYDALRMALRTPGNAPRERRPRLVPDLHNA